MNIYREKYQAWLAGVCAGVAKHFNKPVMAVRLLFLFLLLTPLNWMLIFGYLIAVFVLKEADPNAEEVMQYDEQTRSYKKRTIFSQNQNTSFRLQRAKERLQKARHRIEKMEAHVTSNKYKMQKEFNKI